MINFVYPSIIIMTFFLLFWGFRFFKGYISPLKFFYWMIFGIYITCLIDLTLFPFPFQKYLIQVMIEDKLGYNANFIPFKIFSDAMEYDLSFGLSIILKQVIGNIVLFIPMGFGIPMLFPKFKLKKVLLIGLLASLSIEVLQSIANFFIGYNYRAVDIDDLIFNFLGTILGLMLWKIFYKFLKKENLTLA